MDRRSFLRGLLVSAGLLFVPIPEPDDPAPVNWAVTDWSIVGIDRGVSDSFTALTITDTNTGMSVTARYDTKVTAEDVVKLADELRLERDGHFPEMS